jgi:hypothetical protein
VGPALDNSHVVIGRPDWGPQLIFLTFTVVFLFASAFTAFSANKWQIKLVGLAATYFFVFILVAQSWPLSIAAVKWISGLMACAILAFTETSSAGSESFQSKKSQGYTFKILALLLMSIVALAIAPQLNEWIFSIDIYQSVGALLLIGIGLMGISLNSRILPVIIGLLSIFAGFEIIYSTVELSSLLAALLAIINLGIAMAGAYLMILPTLDKSL